VRNTVVPKQERWGLSSDTESKFSLPFQFSSGLQHFVRMHLLPPSRDLNINLFQRHPILMIYLLPGII
jgi:hypothetical protein